MESKMDRYENCWDYWHCADAAKKKCPAYKTEAGRACWIYTDNLKVFEWARKNRSFDTCMDCPWYKHVNEKGVNA